MKRLMVATVAMAALAGCASGPSPANRPGGPADFGEPAPRPRIDALLLSDFDVDRDRRIGLAEAAAHAPAAFKEADANSDAVLGAIELRSWGERAGGQSDAAPLMASVDRNGDGAVTAEEFTLWATARLTGLDENRDGFVSRAEMFELIAPPGRPARPQVLTGP